MICNKCNRKNENDRKKCKHCGAKLNSVTLPKNEKTKIAQIEVSQTHNTAILVCCIVSFALTVLGFFISLYTIISLAALACAIVASVFAIKSKQLLTLSTVALALASASLSLNLYVFILAILV